MEKTALTILIFLFGEGICLQLNTSSVHSDCLKCVKAPYHTCYKIKWTTSSTPVFACRASAMFVSRFALSVETACIEEDCNALDSVLDGLRERRMWYFSCHHHPVNRLRHEKLVKIVRDYVEIIFLGILCGVLVLKKQMLLRCIKKRSLRLCPDNDQQISWNPATQFPQPLITSPNAI